MLPNQSVKSVWINIGFITKMELKPAANATINMKESIHRFWDPRTEVMHYDGVFQTEQWRDLIIRPSKSVSLFFPFEGAESGEMITGNAIDVGYRMECTGLRDPGGFKIFEGDLLLLKTNYWMVVWSEQKGCWCAQDQDGSIDYLYNFDGYKIAGNIFQDSHLFPTEYIITIE